MHPHDLTGSETWNIVEPCWLTDRREPSARQGFENWILKTKPRLGRSPGEGKSYPLQYSGLEKSMVTVHGVAKSQTRLSNFHFTPSFVIFLYQIFWYLPFFLNDIAQNFLINIMTGPSFFYSDSQKERFQDFISMILKGKFSVFYKYDTYCTFL